MPLVFDGIHRAEKMSESSSTASNNNQLLATANHHDNVKQPSTDIATTTTKQSNSTRQYKSKNNDKDKDIMSKSSKSKSAAATSSTKTTNCKTATSSSSASSSMARSNRRQSIHRFVKSIKPLTTTSVPSTAASTSTSSNGTSSILQTTTTTPSNQQEEQYQENDTFLSLSNPTYKSVLYTHFQQMNNNDSREEEKRVATKITNIFKKNGGRFYKKSGTRGNVHSEMNFVQVDEDAALRKIQDDIRRRRENAQHWQHQQTTTAPPEEADIPSPSISTTQVKTDKKNKSSKKSISIVRREAAKLGWESRKNKSEQSNDDNEDEDMADEDGSMSNSSTEKETRTSKKSNISDETDDAAMSDDTAAETPLVVVKKEIKKRESKARTVKLTHPHASTDVKSQPSPTVKKEEKKKSKSPVKKTKKSIKPSRTTAGKSQQRQKTTTIRAARPSEKKQADAQQVVKSNGMTEWQCPKCSKKFAWKSPQCAGACISNHMRNSHGITLPTMKELSQKKKETKKKKSVVIKSPARRVVGGTSRSLRSSGVSTSASSSSTIAKQQPKQQEKTKKRGRQPSAKEASVTFDSDIQSYLGEEPVKKKRKSDSTSTRGGGLKKISDKGNTPPSQAVTSKSKRAPPSRRQSSAKTTNHVTPTSMQKAKSPDSASLVVIEGVSSTKKSGTNKLNFAQKLHAMIIDADENHPDTLCWNEDGDSFIVKERDTPLQPLLSRYFRTAKYTSLYRSLTNYGFVADYIKIQEKDVVCFTREDFTRDSTSIELSCFTKDKSTTAEKIVSIKEEAAATLSMPVASNHDKTCTSADSRRSVPKRKAFTNACGVIQGAMTEQDDTSPTKEEEEDSVVFEVGQRIESRYRGQGRRWYKGTIVASLGNGLYDIDYDDGDSDRGLSADAIRVRMPRRKKITKKKKQQQKSAEQSRNGEDDDMMFEIDTFNNNTQQDSAPLLNERQRIIFDLVSVREEDSVDKENTNKAETGLFSPIKAKRVIFANVPSTIMEEEEPGVVEKTEVEVVNDSSFSPIKPFNQVKSKDSSSRPPTNLDTPLLAKSTTQTSSSPTQVIISSKSQAVKKEQMMQPFVLVKVGVIDNEVVMPPSKDDDISSQQEDTTDTFQGLLSPESDSNTPSSKDPGDDLFQFNWDGRATSSDDFLADEIGYDLFSNNRMTTSSSYSSRRVTYATGRGTMYPISGHGKARTSSSWDMIRL